MGLALLVVVPVMAGATYTAYRDLFELTPPVNEQPAASTEPLNG